MTNPWNRRTDESDKAWMAFVEYRDGGAKRSLEVVSKALSKSVPLMKRWSAAYAWVDRAAAWDANLDKRKQAAAEETAEEVGRRQARLGKTMQEVGGLALKSFKKAPASLKGSETASLIKAGVEIERLGRGMATSKAEHTGPDGGPIPVDVTLTARERIRRIFGDEEKAP